jgi:general secretion pathway protein J
MDIAIMLVKRTSGFTLLEVLIALFIFTIVSMMMVGGLHTVMTAQSGTDRSAERLRELQIVLIRMSRDVEQIVNRPVKNNAGQDNPAFQGTPRGFAFTHGGRSQQANQAQGLQRAEYIWSGSGLWRMAWEVLDQAANSQKPGQRLLIGKITEARFEYLDDKNAFQANWPAAGNSAQPLPRAIRISLTIADWGTVRQIYVIPAQVIPAALAQPKS